MPPRGDAPLPQVGTDAADRIADALCMYHTGIADYFGVDGLALHTMIRNDPGYIYARNIFPLVYAQLVGRGVTAREMCAAIDKLCPWMFLSVRGPHGTERCKYLLRDALLRGSCNIPGTRDI